jgi:phosphotransferase system enzyme I (PtsP)
MRDLRGRAKNSDRSKLESLGRVIREVDSAPDTETALRVVVERTHAIMAADVCTVYFTEYERQRHVIVATDGLSPTVAGHVQFGFCKGLIGRVAESTKPVNLDHVPEQLDQGFVQQSGAGCFHGFLGVPITHRSKVQGVLVERGSETGAVGTHQAVTGESTRRRRSGSTAPQAKGNHHRRQ